VDSRNADNLALPGMQHFSSATNLFGFFRLSEVVIEGGNIRMQVRQKLSQLCFLYDHIHFKRQFLLFTPAEAFLKPLYELYQPLTLTESKSGRAGKVSARSRDFSV
jgi:hypothetical protein